VSVGISAQTIGRSNHGEEGKESESESEGKDEESESGQKGRGREEKEEDRSDEGGAEEGRSDEGAAEEGCREAEAEEATRTQARPGACRDSGTGAILDNARQRQRQRRGLVSDSQAIGNIGCARLRSRAILFRQPEAKTVSPNLGRLEQAKLLAFRIQSAIPIAPGQPAQ
jgi:hypothetical protein